MADSAATRPAPSASGTLAKTPLLHLLLYAHQRNLAGTIELFAPDKRNAAVLFVNGEPAKVRTSEPVAYLGRVLLELGHLNETQLDRSLTELAAHKREGNKLHGEVLLAQGLPRARGSRGDVHLRQVSPRLVCWGPGPNRPSSWPSR